MIRRLTYRDVARAHLDRVEPDEFARELRNHYNSTPRKAFLDPDVG